MYLLSDKQIDFIYDDLKQKGIVLDDLQQNLLDHICCIVEQELEEGEDFEQCYASVVKRFYKDSLSEIEEETQLLLTFKHFYTMKKLMIGSGITSIAILGFGVLFKYLYMPGSAALIVGGILLLSFVFLPLYFTLKIKEEKQMREKVLIAFTSLVCICVSLSILFKVMHWPGANALGLVALFMLLLGFLPVYLITGIRQADNKVNTIVTSVLILAGCGLFLTLTRSPRATAIQRGLISGNLNRSEMILQGELKLVPQLHDSSTVSAQMVQVCEKLKEAIVLEETGCSKLIADNGCAATSFTEGPLSDYANANPGFYDDMQQLDKLIETYNRMIEGKGQTAIPLSTMTTVPQHETLSGAVTYFIQVEMMVLQNERMLLASK